MVQAAQELAEAGTPSSPRSAPIGKGRSHSRIPSAVHEEGAHESEATLVDSRPNAASNGVHDAPVDEQTPLLRSSSHESQDSQDNHDMIPGGHHGHGHGSMNMHALLLHVFGDALGNIGVIATGLVIWRTNWSFRYYFDPVISLVITIIIFSSALPLGKSARFPL